MAMPLKKIIYATGIGVAIILCLLLILGGRQYHLYKSHEQVTSQAEKLIFQFGIIREHVSESLLDGQSDRLSGVADELGELNSNLTEILSNKHIASEYKLSFASSIDLPGIILLVRKIESGALGPENFRQLNREIRTVGERLMLFDRVLVTYAKRKLIGFQNVVIGALAIVVCLVIVILLSFHQQLLTPFLDLVRQVKEVSSGKRRQLAILGSHGEVSDLAYSFHDLLLSREATNKGLARFEQVTSAVKKALRVLARSKDREQLERDICRALLSNQDYCLVWFGRPTKDGSDVMPVSADGSTTMTSKECDSCLSVLLTEAEDKGIEHNAALLALKKEKAQILTNILEEVPRGLLKGTPLAGGYAGCAALPLAWQGKVYGILSIYTVAKESFSDKEMELLEGLANDVGLSLYSMDEQERLRTERNLKHQILLAVEAAELHIDADGRIIKVNEVFEQLSGLGNEAFLNRTWQEILSPQQESGVTLEELAEAKNDFSALLKGKEVNLSLQCHLLTGSTENDQERRFVCICRRQGSANGDTGGELLSASRLAVFGELSTGVAHEISDLTNGIINYAQVLADDEERAHPGMPQPEMLGKIIDVGERISSIVRKLIFYGQEQDGTGEFIPLCTVLEDSLLLIGYHLKSDGVQLAVELAEEVPKVPVHAQQMQQVFLNILNNARRALNQKYPGKDSQKQLKVASELVQKDTAIFLVISIIDHGVGIGRDFLEQVFAQDYTTKQELERAGRGLAISRQVVESHGGAIEIESKQGEWTKVAVSFPVHSE